MRSFLFSTVLLASLPACAAVPAVATLAAPADSSILSEKFAVNDSTQVPGTTLKSGSYTIRVVDHMSDRSILRIEKEDGKVVTTFLAVPNRALGGSTGPVEWQGGSDKNKALKGYVFPGSFSVEFVYPKEEAVKIATTHSAAVEAIDPSSDNLSAKDNKLSQDDMRIVTLWTLSPTRVNGTVGIAAEKRKPETEPVVARNEPPAPPVAPRVAAAPVTSTDSAVPAPASTTAPAVKAPRPARKPVAAALPHTASELPAVLLTGMLALCGIVALRMRRLLGGQAR